MNRRVVYFYLKIIFQDAAFIAKGKIIMRERQIIYIFTYIYTYIHTQTYIYIYIKRTYLSYILLLNMHVYNACMLFFG